MSSTFSGASAWKVWHTIYQENCFDGCNAPQANCCREKRVFFRLISGLQSSIMTQIALDYRFNDGRYVCRAAAALRPPLERN